MNLIDEMFLLLKLWTKLRKMEDIDNFLQELYHLLC